MDEKRGYPEGCKIPPDAAEAIELRAQLAAVNDAPDMGLIEVTDRELQSVHLTPGRVLGDPHYALHITARAPNQPDITVRLNARQVSRLFRVAMAEVQAQLAAANAENARLREALEEGRAALYGAREVCGNIANIGHAISLADAAPGNKAQSHT